MKATSVQNPLLLQLLQNPVTGPVNFNLQSAQAGLSTISIYTITGTRLFTIKAAMHQGLNTVSLNAGVIIAAGTYILELSINNQRSTTKFIKQ